MKYYVTYKIDARYIVEVEADSLENVIKNADEKYVDSDFGVAEDINGEKIVIENENGDYVWER